jgi:tetratricopeptide (TPR) repeat protein
VSETLRRHAAAVALLVAAVAALYGRVLGYDFVKYDDHELLVEHYGDLVNTANLARVFWRDSFAVLGPEAHGIYYRPLLIASYATDARIAGARPAMFHATNLALHGLATVLVYALLVAFGTRRVLAAGLALIFAVHPASALVAAWIPCRNESMLAIACVSSTLALLAFLRTGRLTALVLCTALYAIALFTKESGGVLLAVFAAAVALDPAGRAGKSRRLAGAGLAAIAASLVWAALRRVALGHSHTGASQALDNLSQLVVYLGKMIFPIGLATVPYPDDTSLLPGVAALAALALAILVARKRLFGPAGLGLVWCAAFLLPSLSVPRQTWGLEHRIYLPLVGLLLFASQWRPPAWLRAPEWLGTALAVAVAIVFATLTARRLPDFAGPIVYWESAARTAPHSAFAVSRVAWRYFQAGRLTEAPTAADRALRLDPTRGDMHLLRGLVHVQQGEIARAEPELLRAVELDPNEASAWLQLARVQQQLGREDESRESRRRVRELLGRATD